MNPLFFTSYKNYPSIILYDLQKYTKINPPPILYELKKYSKVNPPILHELETLPPYLYELQKYSKNTPPLFHTSYKNQTPLSCSNYKNISKLPPYPIRVTKITPLSYSS